MTTDSVYQSINTPEDNTCKTDKVSNDVTVDKIQQQRIDEISTSQQQNKMFA